MEVKKVMPIKLIMSAVFLWFAEVLASLAIWRGAPTDWSGEPPHFWNFEMWRLEYWALLFSLAVLLWVIASYGLRRRVHKIAPGLFGAALAVTVEVLTSIWYWKQLPWTQASYLGWSHFRWYFWDHLISWAVVVFIGLALWHSWNRTRRTHPLAPTTR